MTIAEFWSWFQKNEMGLRIALESRGERCENISNNFVRHLESFAPILSFKMQKKKKTGIIHLAISCCGDPEYFILVKRLVAAAPKLPLWKIKAFIQPKNIGGCLEHKKLAYENFEFKVNDIKFSITEFDLEKGIFNLIIRLPVQLSFIEDYKLREFSYYTFQDLFGERFVFRRINDVSFTFQPHKEHSFLELGNLHFFLENFEEMCDFYVEDKPSSSSESSAKRTIQRIYRFLRLFSSI